MRGGKRKMSDAKKQNAMYLLKIGTNGFYENELKDLFIGNRFAAAVFNYSNHMNHTDSSELWAMDLKEGFCIPVLISHPGIELGNDLYKHLIGNNVLISELIKNKHIDVVDQGWIRRVDSLEEQIHECGNSLTINYLAGKTNEDEKFMFYMTGNGFYYHQLALNIGDTPKNLHI